MVTLDYAGVVRLEGHGIRGDIGCREEVLIGHEAFVHGFELGDDAMMCEGVHLVMFMAGIIMAKRSNVKIVFSVTRLT